jgi:hypothetical protein
MHFALIILRLLGEWQAELLLPSSSQHEKKAYIDSPVEQVLDKIRMNLPVRDAPINEQLRVLRRNNRVLHPVTSHLLNYPSRYYEFEGF